VADILRLVVNPDIQGPAHEFNPIKLRNGLLRILGRMEPHETKASLAAITALRDFGTINLPTLTEVVFELTPSSLPREIADKELTPFLGGSTLHVGVVVTVLVPATSSTSTVVSSSSVVTTSALTVLANKDGTAMKLSVLEFADGTGCFGWLLVDDNAAAFGASVVSLENVGLDKEKIIQYYVSLGVLSFVTQDPM
jgi:hypothetical protein